MEIAQQRMLGSYPFHARFLARWQTHPYDAVKTMGVTIEGGSLILYYNPEFVLGCSLPELVGVLLHEVGHVLYGHLHLDHSRLPDGRALTIAEEVTCNEHILEPLPGSPLLLAHYPALPPDEDTLSRYRRLAEARKSRERIRPHGKGGPGTKNKGGDVPNSPPAGRKNGPRQPDSHEVDTLDDHGLWTRARSDSSAGKLAIKVMVREAAAELTPDQWKSMPNGLRKRVAEVLRGDGAGRGAEQVSPSADSRVDWGRLLRRFVQSPAAPLPAYSRPSRRFPDLVGVIPGQLHRPTRLTVMVVVDTSGSIRSRQLGQISRELDRIASTCNVTVVECDARVQAVYPYRGEISCFRGRGGTDLRPSFERPLLKRLKPDAIIVFTDGFGPAPSRRPGVPTLWCLTQNGHRPAGWGLELRLPF